MARVIQVWTGSAWETLTGSPGVGVPVGGATGQVLAKASAADNDTAWIDPPASGPSPFLLMGG